MSDSYDYDSPLSVAVSLVIILVAGPSALVLMGVTLILSSPIYLVALVVTPQRRPTHGQEEEQKEQQEDD